MSTASSQGAIAAVGDALRSETRLLEELIGIMREERAAVLRDDLAAVDDHVFATQRVLHTLGEAKRRRQALYRLLGAADDAGARGLEEALGPRMTEGLRSALAGLLAAARLLSSEVELNRRALRQALASDEASGQLPVGAGALLDARG